MKTIKVFELIPRRVLVTRASARSIEPNLAGALTGGQGKFTLDFSGVDGLTPSFLDEVLSILDEHTQDTSGTKYTVTMTNPPTELSSKFAAVGRGHEATIDASPGGSWTISGGKQKPVLGR
jgi:hypothetical protein